MRRVRVEPGYDNVHRRHKVPGTTFLVDAFQYKSPETSAWFLTHFHADHYGGLSKHFRFGTIYCTPTTMQLVRARFGVAESHMRCIQVGKSVVIEGVLVTPLDANHCPGSVLLLFQHRDGERCTLHCGDMRYHPRFNTYEALQKPIIDFLFLDTTYSDPRYKFIAQERAIELIVAEVQSHWIDPSVIFLVGTYSIGKERILLALAKELSCRIFVNRARFDTIRCCDLGLPQNQIESIFTTDPKLARIHVVPLGSLSFSKLADLETSIQEMERACGRRYSRIVAFRPTGWTQNSKRDMTKSVHGSITVWGVPYSEHSSFDELREWVKFLRPKSIIPTVNAESLTQAKLIIDLFADLMDNSDNRNKIVSYFKRILLHTRDRIRVIPDFPTDEQFSKFPGEQQKVTSFFKTRETNYAEAIERVEASVIPSNSGDKTDVKCVDEIDIRTLDCIGEVKHHVHDVIELKSGVALNFAATLDLPDADILLLDLEEEDTFFTAKKRRKTFNRSV